MGIIGEPYSKNQSSSAVGIFVLDFTSILNINHDYLTSVDKLDGAADWVAFRPQKIFWCTILSVKLYKKDRAMYS